MLLVVMAGMGLFHLGALGELFTSLMLVAEACGESSSLLFVINKFDLFLVPVAGSWHASCIYLFAIQTHGTCALLGAYSLLLLFHLVAVGRDCISNL